MLFTGARQVEQVVQLLQRLGLCMTGGAQRIADLDSPAKRGVTPIQERLDRYYLLDL